jgi:hypothetical protein
MEFPQRYVDAQEVLRKERVLESKKQNKANMESRNALGEEEKRKEEEEKETQQQQQTGATGNNDENCMLS